jgi:glycosyltransferase involved in cell wall biosynthesis
VRHVSDPEPGRLGPADLCLLEAPHPRLLETLDRAPRPSAVIYDAIDLWDGSLGAGWYHPAAEARAIARADLLVASSELLRGRLAAQADRPVALVPNAVDLRLFDPAIPRERPRDVRAGHPTVLYVGALWGEWVDVGLIAAVARAVPRAVVHLLGPTGGRSIPRLPNLHVLGPRPREAVPAYLACADVAILPFLGSALADAVSPLKLFEYLAMGVPVVSTPLAEVAARPGVIAVARDESSFISAVERAARERLPAGLVRAEVADQGWSSRVDRILALVEREG